jgi:RNA polymerase sigma-54 factor
MPSLQPKLNLKVAQRQILTPGLMQMVSVLALNNLELKEMIHAEMVENPVLEEIDETVPLLDDVEGRREQLDVHLSASSAEPQPSEAAVKDAFEEIDFGSYFQEYLDPGFRTQREYEEIEKPSFENFLSQPTTLSDHLAWQLGAMTLEPTLRAAAEFIVGNLDENGYLPYSDQELQDAHQQELEGDIDNRLLHQAIHLIQTLDPAGVGARNLRECLLIQIAAQQREFDHIYPTRAMGFERDVQQALDAEAEVLLEERHHTFSRAADIVDKHITLLQKRDLKELSRAIGSTQEQTHAAVEFIRTLDPRPGARYNREQARLIEPDVAFVKRDDEWGVVINDDDMPSLRLSHQYRRLLSSTGTEKEVKEYVKERFRSAVQLMRNIAQRKSTIMRTCEVIVRRQRDFLDKGIEALHPMMIKEVAEEIGVHPSTVSRAVANKYAHTPQGVLELRFFFNEGANGSEGADTTLVVLKRKVRKFIEDEDAAHPLTDEHLAAMLQTQGIQVTRRTVAKYREDLKIPPTHMRRKR